MAGAASGSLAKVKGHMVAGQQTFESQAALHVIADSVLVSAVHAVRGGARSVQQLLQRGAFALETLQLLQVRSRRRRHSPNQLKRVDVG